MHARELGAAAALGLVLGAGVLADAAAARPHWVPLLQARGGFTYFNKPGADLASHNTDMRACVVVSSNAQAPYVASGQGVLGDALANGMAQTSAFYANVENCMVLHGWRVIRVAGGEGARVLRASRRGDRSVIVPWIGAAEPPGEVVRAWGNDALRPNGGSLEMGGMVRASLSYLVVPGYDGVAFAPLGDPIPNLPKRSPAATPPKPLTQAQIAALPADAALIVVRVTGAEQGTALDLMRAGPTPDVPAWAVDQKPDQISAVLPNKPTAADRRRREATHVFSVEPGRWRLTHLIWRGFTLNFCLGAPAFDLKPGEVIYAGAFDVDDDLTPNMDLAPARDALAQSPAGVLRVKAASWSNGDTYRCQIPAVYALELPGAPFVPGYALGGKLPR